MKSKKTGLIIALVIIFLTLIYIFLAVKPLSKEFHFDPEWKISLASPALYENTENKDTLYFKLGQTLGYVTEDGKVTEYKTFPFQASICDNYYAIYNANASNTPFYNNKGEVAGIIHSSGYPYFIDNKIFNFLPGGTSIEKLYPQGNVEWTYEGILPITAFASKNKYTALGFNDGQIKVFDNDTGSSLIEFSPGGCDYPVIMGLDISGSGDYIAALVGHEKQRFIISEKSDKQQRIIVSYFFEESSPFRSLVHFTKDDSRVFYILKKNIGIYDFTAKEQTLIPLNDKIINIEEADDLVFLLGKSKNHYTVYMIDKTNTLEGKFSFSAQNAFMKIFNNNLYVGNDTSLSKISLKKE